MMEPTGNELHAGCLGNVNATWTFHGRSGHSARPWDADNAIHAAARAIASFAAFDREEHSFDGLSFFEVASVTGSRAGSRRTWSRIGWTATSTTGSRPAARRTKGGGAAARAVRGRRAADRLAGAVRPGRDRNPRAQALIAAGDLRVAPKQAWTPVAEFGAAGLDAVNFGQARPSRRTAATSRSRSRRWSARTRCWRRSRGEALPC